MISFNKSNKKSGWGKKAPPVEIIASKKATREEIKKINEANKTFQEVFDRNHFRIYLVAGGRDDMHNSKVKPRKV